MGWVKPQSDLADLTVGQLVREWYDWYGESPDAKRGTLKAHGTRVRMLEATPLWDKPIAGLRPYDLEDTYRAMQSRGLSARTVAGVHSVLSSAFSWGGRRWDITHIPSRAKAPSTKYAKIVTAIPPDELGKIVAEARSMGGPLHLFVELIAGSGMRRGEALGLQWGDVNLTTGKASIERQRSHHGIDTLKTRRSRRVCDLSADCTEVLRVAIRSGDAIVGWGPTQASRAWREMVDRLGMDWTIHQVRHSVATKMLADGIPVPTVAAQLGDTPQVVMQTYAHAIPDLHREKVTKALSW
jgi:integrase